MKILVSTDNRNKKSLNSFNLFKLMQAINHKSEKAVLGGLNYFRFTVGVRYGAILSNKYYDAQLAIRKILNGNRIHQRRWFSDALLLIQIR